ncbi:hypothetical protein [Providencia sp. R33]|uniref:hypothetical protein n=1 Tax=Providencia sp. R33 TaxID=2828763 RepID=UPI002105F07C
MKILPNKPINTLIPINSVVPINHPHDKINLIAKGTTLSASSTIKHTVNISPKTQEKIDKFIEKFQSKETDKEFFSTIFSTLIRLKKNEKENFIAGTAQVLKSLPNDGMPSLYDKFTNGLKRYMAINLMNQPFTEQLNKNISSFNIDGNDEDD